MRIGEVARRLGVSVSTVRAWEQRYRIFDPARTAGGHRLYDEDDLARLLAVQDLVAQGWTLPAAVRRAVVQDGTDHASPPGDSAAPPELIDLVERSDRPGALQLVQRMVGDRKSVV